MYPTGDWHLIEGFPGYAVNEIGDVYNEAYDRFMVRAYAQSGVATVGLNKEGKQYRRSVARLVAVAFLDNPPNEHYDTIVHLDGDKTNCREENLAWRPRWYAIRYHREILEAPHYRWSTPIVCVETGDIFEDSKEAAMTFGVLQYRIAKSVIEGDAVFPQGYTFTKT